MTQATSIFQEEEENSQENKDQLIELMPLFPTPILIKRYENDLSEEIKYLKLIEYTRNNLAGAGGNLQSENSFILKEKELSSIKEFIENSLKEYCQKVIDVQDELKITQSWVNKSGVGQGHHMHTHPNSVVSGVFYFQSDIETAPIQFRKKQNSSFRLKINNLNHFNSETFNLHVTSGDLIIFPSSLEHCVLPNQSTSDRISMSFNTFPKESSGSIMELTYLPLGEDE